MNTKNINEMCFASFFMGEGMIRISKDYRKSGNRKSPNYGKEKVVWYRQVARITLRSDDSKIIDWVLKNIGGHCFYREKRNNIYNKQKGTYTFSNPTIIWQAEDIETCKRISKMLIDNPLPAKKKKEAKYFLKYIELKEREYKRGKAYSQDTLKKFEFYYEKLKELKKYNEK